MPIYEYEREDGTVFEIIQKMTDAVLATCPTTGQTVKRKISASLPIFNGSGFYKTDYCSKPSEAKSTSASSSSEGTSKDSKTKSCGTGCGCH